MEIYTTLTFIKFQRHTKEIIEAEQLDDTIIQFQNPKI